jgi:signal transduction histidine kinase/DNA-binding response OmpR family regulator
MSEDALEKRVFRERRAREAAERALESKSSMLWEANSRLRALAQALEVRASARAAEAERARTDVSRTRAELDEARRDAEHANVAKSEFLAQVSHEIRTPMTAILGYAEMLDGGDADAAESERWIRQLRLNAQYLMDLVGDVLDVSRIESGRFDLRRVEVDLIGLVDEIITLQRPRAEDNGLLLSANYQNWPPRYLSTDPVRLRQILVNLISNAIKYTHEGTVRLEVRVANVGGESELQMDVVDTGPGIQSADAERIFAPYVQVTRLDGRRGVGLGLNITKQLTQLLGYEIELQSEVGVGSRFRLRIPLRAAELEERIDPASHVGAVRSVLAEDGLPLAGASVLVADDTVDNRRILGYMLGRAGARVSFAVDGAEAVEIGGAAFRRGAAFDVILMDLQMPEVNGFEATSGLRAQGVSGPIVALSADVSVGARARSREAGCDAHLGKPVVSSTLVAAIRAALSAPGRETPPRAARQRAEAPDLPDWIVQDYLARLTSMRDSLEASLRAGVFEDVRALAHQLAGSGTSYGFPEITAAGRACEEAIDKRAAPAIVSSRVADLVAALDLALDDG